MVHEDIHNYQSVKLKELFITLEGICVVSTPSIFLHRIMMTMKIMHFGFNGNVLETLSSLPLVHACIKLQKFMVC